MPNVDHEYSLSTYHSNCIKKDFSSDMRGILFVDTDNEHGFHVIVLQSVRAEE
jgi:hypothetical protein